MITIKRRKQGRKLLARLTLKVYENRSQAHMQGVHGHESQVTDALIELAKKDKRILMVLLMACAALTHETPELFDAAKRSYGDALTNKDEGNG